MISDPKKYWDEISQREDWKDHILPRKDDLDFNVEGLIEAHRLFYFFDKDSIVVDYGCGIGRVLKHIAKRAKYVVGLDICQSFLNKAQEIKKDNIAYYLSDEYKKENVADMVYCLMVMQHNDKENQEKIINHIYKILKVGGTAVISFPKGDYYQESETLHKFSKEEVGAFGSMFFIHRIIEGSLPNYEKKFEGNNEYFLIAIK